MIKTNEVSCESQNPILFGRVLPPISPGNLGVQEERSGCVEQQFYWLHISLKTQSSLLCPSGWRSPRWHTVDSKALQTQTECLPSQAGGVRAGQQRTRLGAAELILHRRRQNVLVHIVVSCLRPSRDQVFLCACLVEYESIIC